MSTNRADYLTRLPERYRYVGDLKRGEIEIVSDPAEIAKILTQRPIDADAASTSKFGIVFEDEYVLVIRDPVRFPSGQLGTYLRVVERASLSGSTGVVALPIREGNVLLLEIFRHATRRWEIEVPRGLRSAEDSAHAAVDREVSEELGLTIEEVQELGYITVNSGLLMGETHLYLVRVGPGSPDPHPESSEAFGRVIELPMSEVFSMIARGEITDSFTLAVLMRAVTRGYLSIAK